MKPTHDQMRKYKGLKIRHLLPKAEKAFNAFVRHRDRNGENFECISCGNIYPADEITAGHFMCKSVNDALRFTEDNVYGQCFYCNSVLGGNIGCYRKRLTKKIGTERVKELEYLGPIPHYWSREELVMIIETYTERIKLIAV